MTSKGSDAAGQPNQECCMCGDCGLSEELFQCKVCHFRSQHRYCSNLYPKAKSYETCNLCLRRKEDIKEKSSNSSSSYKIINGSANNDKKSKSKKIRNGDSAQNIGLGVKKGPSLRASALQLQLDKPIKKQNSPSTSTSPSPSPSVLVSNHKKIITNDASEERLRRINSEDVANITRVTRKVFRNKVRKYKLLDEVLS